MSTKVVINGLGRIGRAILKLVIDEPALELVAVKRSRALRLPSMPSCVDENPPPCREK